MKLSINRHKCNLNAMKGSSQRMKEEIERKQAAYQWHCAEVATLEAQIKRAVKEGKEFFDCEKYNIKKKKS